jgi:competence protein ComEC
MQLWIWGCIAGLALSTYWPEVPPALPVPHGAGIPLALLLGICLQRLTLRLPHSLRFVLRAFFALLIGIYLGLAQLQQSWEAMLPQAQHGELQRLEGRVEGAIHYSRQFGKPVARFAFELETPAGKKQRLLLSWPAAPELAHGQRWQLFAKLRRPRGLANPAGFDYQLHLMQQGIYATGVVRQGKSLSVARGMPSFAALRSELLNRVEEAAISAQSRRVLLALGLGDKQAQSQQDWLRYQLSGTTHLFIVSGLHISLLAGLVYFLLRRMLGFMPLLLHYASAQRMAILPAVAAAFTYAEISGYGLPAQRAFLMLLLAAVLRYIYGRVPLALLFSMVLFLLLVQQPLLLRSAGLHLSFLAVAILLWQNLALSSSAISTREKLMRWGRAQLLVTCFLTPVLLYWFGSASLIAPLANALAIPLVSLVLVPLALFLLLLLALGVTLPTWLAALPGHLLELLDMALETLLGFSAQLNGQPSLLVVILSLCGIALLAAPRGMPGRWLAPVLMLPLFFPRPIPTDEIRLTMLDVGQGLALVFEARGRVLVYDAGPRYESGFDAGQAVLLPYLRARGYKAIDVLVISHGDMDHAGGSQALAQMPVRRHWHGEVARNNALRSPSCHEARAWRWQDVTFEFLPLATELHDGNNRSCVLLIQAGGQRLLLTGDIEAEAEHGLLAAYGVAKLSADILLSPHHGSKTSSSAPFLAAVSPQIVLISSGFANRFGHPYPAVTARYQQHNSRLFNTAEDGAVSVIWTSKDKPIIERLREKRGRFWWRPVH